MTRMRWVKLWTQESLYGTTFRELEPEERFVWFAFLALAGDSPVPGTICLAPDVPYPDEQLAQVLAVPKRVLQKARRKMVKTSKIQVENGLISIINWPRYQADYARVERFRNRKRRETASEETASEETAPPDQTRLEDRVVVMRSNTKEDGILDNDASLARLQAHYESAFGQALTPTRAQKLAEMAEDFGTQAILDALDEAAKRNKSDPRYAEAILRRWRTEGRPRKGDHVEKGGRNDESDLDEWAIRNWQECGYASEADARQAILGG